MLSRYLASKAKQPPRCFSALSVQGSVEGVDFSVNWALAKSGVIPKEKAYRNLGPLSLAKQSASATKTSFSFSRAVESTSFVASSPASFAVALKNIQNFLSASHKLYTSDCAIGSSMHDSLIVRSVTDDAAAAQLYQNLLFSIPLRPATHVSPRITVLHASSLTLAADVATSLGVTTRACILSSAAKQTVLVIGPASVASITAAVTQLALTTLATAPDARATALSAAVVLGAGATAAPHSLVLGASGPASQAGALLLWGARGYAPAWAATPRAAAGVTLQKGCALDRAPLIVCIRVACDDVVDTIPPAGGGVATLTRADASLASLWAHPLNVFLATKDATGAIPALAKLSPSQARLFFALGHAAAGVGASEHAQLADRFAKLVAENKTNVYLCNQHLVPDHVAFTQQVASALPTVRFVAQPALGFGVPVGAVGGLASSALSVDAPAAEKLAIELVTKAKAAFPKLAVDGVFAPVSESQ